MKILAADDQPLILKSISNKLKNAGYDLVFAQDGQETIDKFDSESPDIVIVDLNMPIKDGFEVIEHIRRVKNSTTPIIVMSGADEENTIVRAFNAGADEYIQKPVGLNELLIRIQKLVRQSPSLQHIPLSPVVKEETVSQKVQKNIVAVVIPCYNEESRLKSDTFKEFVHSNLGYHLCFVNDGSKDNTLGVLKELARGLEDHVTVYDCPKNGGKAEAVRQGIQHMIKDPQLDYIGYLDADLSTNFLDFDDLVETISSSNFKIVGGSRIARMGADITKAGSRAIISKTINLIIRRILGMSFQDTQCGAKVMTRDIAELMFKDKFLTSWLFDVEIFMRMKKHFGDEEAIKLICEQPLKRWIHEDGSKLSMKDSFKIIFQLGQIALTYR
jgi:DNA-binding response OmpR family regulator